MDRLTPEEASALMARIVAQDQTALAELYDLFSGPVYGMAMRVLQNTTLAEEATQDTFMKIWRHAERWNPERGTLSTYLLTIARYTAVDRLRKEQRASPWTAVGLDDLLNLIGESGAATEARFFDSELLRELLHQLPEEQIEAIELAYYKGLSHNEVAEHTQQPLGTIKSRIRDGIRKLRGMWLQERNLE